MDNINELTFKILSCAYKVHSKLGPGLLESTYEHCLAQELFLNGCKFDRQQALPVIYGNTKLDAGYRIDLLVEDRVIIELKSVEQIIPIHKAQLLTYMKLSGKHLGLLINFNVVSLKDGITRLIL
ncbi:MAG: GxxExxY protein [Bacteroidales bacterium]|jgi:GxxExxY protein|nr:GxxExxY protein [Bacteroidales bacterium]